MRYARRLAIAVAIAAVTAGTATGTASAVTFSPYGFGIDFPWEVVAADFNRDGRDDLVDIEDDQTGNTAYLYIRFGRADGTMSDPAYITSFSDGGAHHTLGTGDWDQDRLPDLAVTRNDSATSVGAYVSWSNQGDGTFEAVGGTTFADPGEVYRLVPIRWNGRVGDQLLVAQGAGTSVWWIGPAIAYPVGGGFVLDLAVGDRNGDGVDDFVSLTNDNVLRFRDFVTSSGGFGAEAAVTLPAPAGRSITMTDVNGDNRDDVILATPTGVRVRNSATGAYQVINLGHPVDSVAAGDFDGDGRPDIAAMGDRFAPAGPTTPPLDILHNTGTSFVTTPTQLGADSPGFHPVTGDIDGDGRLDLAMRDGNRVKVFRNRSLALANLPAGLAFGSVAIGSPSPSQLAQLKNLGAAAMPVQAVDLVGPDGDEFRIAGDDCTGRTLAVGATCKLYVRFDPDRAGAATASLRVRHRDGEGLVPLTGTGTAAAAAASTTATAAPSESAPLSVQVTTGPLVVAAGAVKAPAAASCTGRRTLTCTLSAATTLPAASSARLRRDGRTVATVHVQKRKAGTLRFHVPSARLHPGRYTLQLVRGGKVVASVRITLR